MAFFKTLIIFDLDNTIITKTSDYELLNRLLTDKLIKYDNWAEFMQSVYIKMKEMGIKIEEIKNIIENIPLTEGFDEIFQIIRLNKHKFHTIIISGSNTLYLKWLIEYHNLNDIIDNYFSNIAEIDDENLIKIKQAHFHQCAICFDKAQCKKKILEEFISEKQIEINYKNILFICDGENDYCPSTILNNTDYLFPREDYKLFDMIYKDNFKNSLRCNIQPWKDGRTICEIIKKLI